MRTSYRLSSLVFSMVILSALTNGCVHSKIKYQKAKLLDPTMDPGKTSGLYTNILNGEASSGNERGSTEVSGAIGASCPTCGG
jgi:hypothetical protein